jgi:hypothetical protein
VVLDQLVNNIEMTRITQYINFYNARRNFEINEEQERLIEKAKSKFIKRRNGIDGYKMPLYKNMKSFRLDLDDIFEEKAGGRKINS